MRNGVTRTISGFAGDTGPREGVVDTDMERRAERPEQERKLLQPGWETGDIY